MKLHPKPEEPNSYVYVVFQNAVYRHGCAGIFSTVKKAVEMANLYAAHDVDNHHQWQVFKMGFDVGLEVSSNGLDWKDLKYIYEVQSPIRKRNWSMEDLNPEKKFVVRKELEE